MPVTDTYTASKLEPFQNPQDARTLAVPLTDGTYAKGTVLAQNTSTLKYAAYDDEGSTGLEVAKGILQYGVLVSNGLVTFGESTASETSAPMYTAGTFYVPELTGLDANGLADLQGRLISGSLTSNGVIHF